MLRLFALGMSSALLALGCSASSGGSPQGVLGGSGGVSQAGGQGGMGGSAVGGSGNSTGGSQVFFDAGGDSSSIDPDAACGLMTQRAESFPLNLYIMLDKSRSMEGYKWEAVNTGLEAFLKDEASAGLNVALNLFPRAGAASCDATLYKAPRVDFGELPGHAATIIAEMNAEGPNGTGTPTYPALGGALLQCLDNGKADPATKNAVLLVTDGNPEWPASPVPTCGGQNPNDTQVIATRARQAFESSPSILTFVVGLEGVQKNFADAVAKAGGTDQAIIVSQTDAAQQFADALKKVRGKALPCEYELPKDVADGTIALNEVNVLLKTDSLPEAETLLQTDDCSQGGDWTYDNLSQPTKILLCDASCNRIKEDLSSELDILLGCETVRIK